MKEFEHDFQNVNAKWHHLSYANCVGKYAYVIKYNSMDVSPSGGKMSPITTDIAFRNVGFNPYHPDSFVWNYVTHHAGGSILTAGKENYEVRHRTFKMGFTVGAGDMLVAEVINMLLPDPERPLKEILKQCHKNVVKELRNEQADFASADSGKG
jgi:hypothetical protein